MLIGLYIFVDDDFAAPIYAEPGKGETEDGLYEAICEAANDALEGDAASNGLTPWEEYAIAWRLLGRVRMTFVCVVTDDIPNSVVERYLKELTRQYLDEVDDPRNPEREGVADVIVDVIPPWEED